MSFYLLANRTNIRNRHFSWDNAMIYFNWILRKSIWCIGVKQHKEKRPYQNKQDRGFWGPKISWFIPINKPPGHTWKRSKLQMHFAAKLYVRLQNLVWSTCSSYRRGAIRPSLTLEIAIIASGIPRAQEELTTSLRPLFHAGYFDKEQVDHIKSSDRTYSLAAKSIFSC